MRTFVLGDVHGAYKAMMQVFERAEFDYKKDRLIQIGDIADGWPETVECVEELMKVKNLIAIRGNHDVWMCEWLETGQTDNYWSEYGGQASMDSYRKTKKVDDPRHLNFFLKQKNYFVDEKKRLYVHAGYNPTQPIVRQSDYCFHFSRDYWNMMLKLASHNLDKPEDVNDFTEVFFGHSQSPKYVGHDRPVNCFHSWNLDQGCNTNYKLNIVQYLQFDLFLLHLD
jgi:serine/threonine protein phosphatase 1